MEETSFDPRRRRLCPDGACVGLIGDDGRCKVCGKSAAGNLSAVPREADGDADGAGDGSADEGEPTTGEQPGTLFADDALEPAEAGGGFDPQRRLCDDGSCVGVIGAGGLCSVCGRRAE